MAEDKPAVKDSSDTAGTSKSDDQDQTDKRTARQYRKRKNSSSESESDKKKRATYKTNIDADSDSTGHSSGSDSSDSEENTSKKKLEKKNTEEKEHEPDVLTLCSEEGESREAKLARTDSKRNNNSVKENVGEDGKKVESDRLEINDEKQKRTVEGREQGKDHSDAKPEPPKRSIWEKRTVGPVFDAALARYFARKAAKSVC